MPEIKVVPRLLLLLALPAIAGCVRQSSGELAQLASRADARRDEQQVAAAHPAEPAPASASRLLPPPEALTDAVITAKVNASLMSDPAMTGSDVSVNTEHGVVNLTGLVASQEQAAIASAHAQREDGVMRVDNHLAVNIR
jgi:hypothetical protein